MKIVSLEALEENLKLFITNPETTDDTEEASRQAKAILKYNKDSSYANYALQIPTNPDFKSLNLSHSLIIIAQYVANIIKSKKVFFKRSKKIKSASKSEIQSMLNLCIRNLDEINFFKPKEKRPKMLENLRNIFYKMDLSDKETRILSSVFASLGKKR